MMQKRQRPPPSVFGALRLRETGQCHDTTFRSAAYSALVPSSTYMDVAGVPSVTLRRFTPCGKYLIALSRNHRDLVMYRFETGGRRALPEVQLTAGLDFERSAQAPPRTISKFVDDEDKEIVGSSSQHGALRFFGETTPLMMDPAGSASGHQANPGGGLLASLPVPLGAGQNLATPPMDGPRAREDVSRMHSCHFARFFTEMYQAPIAQNSETLVRDFCLCTPSGRYVILASFHARDAETPQQGGDVPAVSAVPLLESFTLHLVEVETGYVKDRFSLVRDFVPLEGHQGVHMRGDMLCVLSIRRQVLHVIKVQEGVGRFVEEARIGGSCRGDDDMVVASARDAEAAWRRRVAEERRELFGEVKRRRVEAEVEDENATETGLGGGKLKRGFYTGLMQRLLVYVYRKYHGDGHESMFYRVVGQYSQLVMLKAQFLDEDHLLIRLGSYEQSRAENVVSTCFFVVYSISRTEILNLFENRSMELLDIYEKYRDLFIGDAAVSATLPPSRNGEGGDRWQREPERNARARLKRTRVELSVLPVSCQSGNMSVYLDRGLFSYNAERMGGLDGTRPVSLRDVQAVKFIGMRTGRLRFKLAPGVGERGRKRKAMFLFHPMLPFVISMEFSLVTPTLFNFHVHGFRGEGWT